MLSAAITEALNKHPFIEVPEDLRQLLATTEELSFVNGCGPESGIFAGNWLTNIDGVCILAPCVIHDFRYYKGECLADKVKADMELLHNLVLVLRNDPGTMRLNTADRQLRFNKAMVLFKFVHIYGFKAFVERKNVSSPETSYLDDLTHSIYITVKTILIPVDIFLDFVKMKLAML